MVKVAITPRIAKAIKSSLNVNPQIFALTALRTIICLNTYLLQLIGRNGKNLRGS